MLQHGFDIGFKEGARAGVQWGATLGLARTLKMMTMAVGHDQGVDKRGAPEGALASSSAAPSLPSATSAGRSQAELVGKVEAISQREAMLSAFNKVRFSLQPSGAATFLFVSLPPCLTTYIIMHTCWQSADLVKDARRGSGTERFPNCCTGRRGSGPRSSY